MWAFFPPRKGKVIQFAQITIVRITPQSRMMDEDNLKAGAKPILDYLKKFGYIVDDTPQWITCTVTQRQGINKKEWATDVTIVYKEESS